jgi:hypothetical protein
MYVAYFIAGQVVRPCVVMCSVWVPLVALIWNHLCGSETWVMMVMGMGSMMINQSISDRPMCIFKVIALLSFGAFCFLRTDGCFLGLKTVKQTSCADCHLRRNAGDQTLLYWTIHDNSTHRFYPNPGFSSNNGKPIVFIFANPFPPIINTPKGSFVMTWNPFIIFGAAF